RVSQAEPVEQLTRAPAAPGRRESLDPAREHEVLTAGGHGVVAGFLGDESDTAPDAARRRGDLGTGDRGRARVRASQGGEDLHGGRLARPVGSEQAEDGAPLDGE